MLSLKQYGAYRGVRGAAYMFALLVDVIVLILSAIVVNIIIQYRNLYSTGPQGWTLFMACFSFVVLIALLLISRVRSVVHRRSAATTVRQGTMWIEPALLLLLAVCWAAATISTALQPSLLVESYGRGKTARAVVAFSIFMCMLMSFLAALTIFGSYPHTFGDSLQSTAPHLTTGTGFGGASGAPGSANRVTSNNVGTAAYDHAMNQPQYSDKMPAGGGMHDEYGTGQGMGAAPEVQPNMGGTTGGYAAGPGAGPTVEGTQVNPAMPEPRM
ncbi:hypothetical protein H4R34_001462 [Dimargaris verticillata]|uniref:MARVEL domain-containing protein n=1 Tax=Dimargaris verticillata TaxID=2761393 RepID=A0A9W8BBC3_9FUNG|nr:hypothetical protein H4R34_001462 [Dimargaris verticillata]